MRACLLAAFLARALSKAQPNILWILADDLDNVRLHFLRISCAWRATARTRSPARRSSSTAARDGAHARGRAPQLLDRANGRAPQPLNTPPLPQDFKQDRLALMPNLARLRAAGAHLVNHVAAQPVCGPSRSSLLAGRFPHNVGYYANEDPASVANYKAVQNNSVGTWLTAAGYHTAFIGKYVNGVEKFVPSGWNFWGAFSTSKGTYK